MPHHTSRDSAAGRLGRCLAAACTLALASCKIVIAVPQGGQVSSDQATVCNAGQTCVIDIADSSYDETFSAIAANGYVFSHWRQAQGYICQGSDQPCNMDAAPAATNAILASFLDSDFEMYLEPVFVPDDSGRYDVNAWRVLLAGLGHSSFRSNSYLYLVMPDAGNCDPGVLKRQATTRFADVLNLIRQLHHLPPVDYDNFYNTQMQQANLVQLANNYFTHFPQPGDTCYTQDAADGAGSANISWSSWQGDPAHYALGWVNDNHNVSNLMAAGHRRWALYPTLGYTSYGQVGGNASMKVFGFGSSPNYSVPADLEYVAFPYRHYPHVLVEKGTDPTPWSISIVPTSGSGNYPYFANATITVTEDSTGNTLSTHSRHTDNSGYGLRNFLSWMVNGWRHDTDYTVTIGNVQMPSGNVTSIQYPVHIDRAELR